MKTFFASASPHWKPHDGFFPTSSALVADTVWEVPDGCLYVFILDTYGHFTPSSPVRVLTQCPLN